jgi:tripartite-type tricarboxylate transporter receptor subunit TctC
MRQRARLLVCSIALGLVWPAAAQEYPTRAMRMVVPFSPGGATDILARLISRHLSDRTGQPVVVENRAGAGGHIGAEHVVKSAPDGYTLVTAGIPHAIGMSLFKKVSYQLDRDLAPITLLATFPSAITVHPSVPAKSVKELISLARARAGQLNYGAVPGSPNHLAIELLNVMGKVKTVHIPYKGAGPVVTDLVAGHLHMASLGLPTVMAMMQAGRVRPLAVTSATRYAGMPDVPTVQESGLPGYEVTSWYGVFAPAQTPPAIIKRLHTEMSAAVKTADFIDRMNTLGAEVSGAGPEEFHLLVRSEMKKWGEIVKASGAPLE